MTPYKTNPHHPAHRRREPPHSHPTVDRPTLHSRQPHVHFSNWTRARLKLLFGSPAAFWFLLGFGTACIAKFAPQVERHPEWQKALQREREEAAELVAAGGTDADSWRQRKKACLSHIYWRWDNSNKQGRSGRAWGDADPFTDVPHPTGPRAWPPG